MLLDTGLEMVLNNKKQIMQWASTHNLNWLIGFHNSVRGLFKDQLQNLEKYENKDKENQLHRSALYDYDRILHINTFLMMYSYLEEWLYHCWKTYVPNIDLVTGEGSIGRFKNVVKQLGVELSSKLWQDLKNDEEVRNCLLHANGRISLYKGHQKKIRTIIEKNPGIKIVKDRVEISNKYLQQFSENISKMMGTLIKQDDQSIY